ncbi:23S rRNA (adenine(2503)-C(2))-methyltransferase RlmN [Rhabdochlamydiaceae symbiont of Dictyostelium giganteum]|uniref:23S rRNA (adenine(2503)-C(2))-methyltransferase RlmN n=1 Tax=Rhabdochlamydiaceae symbiont of Dictyostelium giganteum TaxID=3342349 RepID=UPI003850CB46
MNQIPLLSLTQSEFTEEIVRRLGKGERHATLLYSVWIREGGPGDLSWVEPQAMPLVLQMIDLVQADVSQVSKLLEDGELKKFLLKLSDGYETESVIIPMKSGLTLCVSSQVGCKMGCSFCETGKMGLIRSLSVQEIIQQLFIAKTLLKADIRNIVFMGMGEPFDNYDAVMKAINVMMDPKGFGLGPRHITVSTSGRAHFIRRFTYEADPSIHLAVSINAPNDEIRAKIMPVNKESSLKELKEVLQEYSLGKKRTILIEYVLLKGVNDALEHADELADYLRGLPVKINLIPYNAQSKARFLAPEEAIQNDFFLRLKARGYPVFLRRHKGRSVMGACGQLGNKAQRLKMYSPS